MTLSDMYNSLAALALFHPRVLHRLVHQVAHELMENDHKNLVEESPQRPFVERKNRLKFHKVWLWNFGARNLSFWPGELWLKLDFFQSM